MTFIQIKTVKDFIERATTLKDNPTTNAICALNKEIIGFFGEDYLPYKLTSVYAQFYGTARSNAELLQDLDCIITALNGKLSKQENIEEILEILADIQNLKNAHSLILDERFSIVSKIYHSYNSVIQFDDGIKNAARYADGSGLSAGEYSEANDSMLRSLQIILNRYAERLCQNKEMKDAATPLIQFTNIATATNQTTIDISLIFEQAKQKVEDEGLSDSQTQEILDKLSELESIAKSKETKGKRWAKIKGIMKWLVEQGIQVAGILLPVMAQSII